MSIEVNGRVLHLSKVFAEALRMRDAYTRLHSDRVMALADGIGRDIGLTQAQLAVLEVAACLHDIGKIVVPDSVLLKPARLDANELKIMQQHSEVGANLLAAYEHEDAAKVAEVIRHHHEWFDGSGYPGRLAGEAIPLLSRIITVVDNYDAMAVRRVYQEARPHDVIVEIMASEAGTKLDPHLVERFMHVIGLPEYQQFKAA